jgi:hypothetical protein
MTEMVNLVNEKENQWNPCYLFTAKHLQNAVAELVLSDGDEQPLPETYLGHMPSLVDIQAHD